MNINIFKSKTVITGIITGIITITNALTGIIPPETAKAIHEVGLLLMGIFLRDGMTKNGNI